MKTNFHILVISCFLPSLLFGQGVGIGTETPTALLDINGDLVLRTADIVVQDSIIMALDVETQKFSSYRIYSDSAITIAGVTTGMDGRMITLINESDYAMALRHEDTLAAETQRLLTGNNQNLVLEHMGIVTLVYDTSVMRWVVNSSNQVPESLTSWDTTSMGVFTDEFVGIGTDSPVAPLTIVTLPDETGFSHIAGVDSITVVSEVSEITGAVGTSTDHVFSLLSGGEGKMHINPNGNVLIGEDSLVVDFSQNAPIRDFDFNSKLVVYTGLSETGYKHIAKGDDEIIVDESIGGVSASFGTASNHTFRLNTNGQAKFNIYPDGRTWIGPGSASANSQLTIWGPNNDFGLTLMGQSDQMFGVRMGGPGGSIGLGAYTPHNFRLVCNGTNALSISATSLNVGIGIDFAGEKLTVNTPGGGFGVSQRADDGSFLTTHIAGGAASIGTWSNTHFRLICNSQNVVSMTPDGKVGIGILFPLQKLDVNGTIRSKEIIVENVNWPDYVFAEQYPLLSLYELETFIDTHHRLPNIPSAAEVEQEGQYVGDMQKRMMEKIEELTLYVIHLQKEIDALKNNRN